jgi:S1-C subfamily serine protease
VTTIRIVFGVMLVLAATTAAAQGRVETGRACPSCDSLDIAAEGERARAIARLVGELADHQSTVAQLEALLRELTEGARSLQERRELETRLATTRKLMIGAEQALRETCGDSTTPRGSIGAVFITARRGAPGDSAGGRGQYPVVFSVTPGSPAARAGLVSGDTVVRIAGRDPRSQEVAGLLEPGKTVEIRLRRGDGALEDVRVAVAPRAGTLFGPCTRSTFILRGFSSPAGTALGRGSRTAVVAARPSAGTGGGPTPSSPEAMRARAEQMARAGEETMLLLGPSTFGAFRRGGQMVGGADVHMLSDGLRAALQLTESDTGAIVVSVDPDTPAGVSGLRSGDVITRVDGRTLTSLDVIVRAVTGSRSRRVQLDVLRAPAARPGGDARGQRRVLVPIVLRW